MFKWIKNLFKRPYAKVYVNGEFVGTVKQVDIKTPPSVLDLMVNGEDWRHPNDEEMNSLTYNFPVTSELSKAFLGGHQPKNKVDTSNPPRETDVKVSMGAGKEHWKCPHLNTTRYHYNLPPECDDCGEILHGR